MTASGTNTPATFERRVKEKQGASRSGASNRISGLESDTLPFSETSSMRFRFTRTWGDGDRAFVRTHPESDVSRNRDNGHKGERDRAPPLVFVPPAPWNHDPFVSPGNILRRQATNRQKRRAPIVACCARTWRGGTQLPRSAPVNFCCCYFAPRIKSCILYGDIFANLHRLRIALLTTWVRESSQL